MQLVPISVDSIRLHQPLPFALLDKNGVLLARRSFVVDSRTVLEDFAARGDGLYIDAADSEVHYRAYVERLTGLVRDAKSLGEIASARVTGDVAAHRVQDDEKVDWLDMQAQANAMLRDTDGPHFLERLNRLSGILERAVRRNPDTALFALVHLSASEVRMYSATHAMLVASMCSLAAYEVLKWPAAQIDVLCRAALCMNLGMTALQDLLATQSNAPSPLQRRQIDSHAQLSTQMLINWGVDDALLLEAVRSHHTQQSGSLQERAPAQRLARLIQRADMFAARLAPRAGRTPVAPAAAMQACYFDENRQVDEAGAALIKAVGIYQPGAFVRLVTDEVAVVVKRGVNTSTPRVAVLISRSGMPTVEPIIRDTSNRDYRVVASVAHREVKVQINLERLLPLTLAPASDRPW